MIDIKNIQESNHFPDGVKKTTDGKLFIDVDIIKSICQQNDYINIEYFDGTIIHWFPTFE